MSEFLEACMIVAFGISWPMNILKSLRTRSAKGKSFPFLCFIFGGYRCGIASKLLSGNLTYVFFFYVLNLCMVGADIFLYFRNRRLDAQRAAAGERA